MNIAVAYRKIPGRDGWATGDLVSNALERMGHAVQRYGNVYQGHPFGQPVINPDLLIYLEMNDADPQYFHLADLKCKKVYWEFDTIMHEDLTKNMLALFDFDHVFMASPSSAEKYGATYLPYAADTEHFGLPETQERSGVAIIGSPFAQRVQFCQETGIPLYNGVFDERYVELIQSLAAHVHFHSSGGHDLIVGRPWETMACGTPLVCQRQETMDRHFLAMAQYLVFVTPEGCVSQCQWIMDHPHEADEMAMNAYFEIQQHHTYEHRMRTILEVACD